MFCCPSLVTNPSQKVYRILFNSPGNLSTTSVIHWVWIICKLQVDNCECELRVVSWNIWVAISPRHLQVWTRKLDQLTSLNSHFSTHNSHMSICNSNSHSRLVNRNSQNTSTLIFVERKWTLTKTVQSMIFPQKPSWMKVLISEHLN